MTPEEQRIAIAEACGWQVWHQENSVWLGESPDGVEHVPIPNYLNDLNAMHEAEKVLTTMQGVDYAGYLGKVVARAARKLGQHHVWHATAAQRAEAFLRTIDKMH